MSLCCVHTGYYVAAHSLTILSFSLNATQGTHYSGLPTHLHQAGDIRVLMLPDFNYHPFKWFSSKGAYFSDNNEITNSV